jgi:hypothetical protein
VSAGKIGKALDFNGSTQYVTVNNSADISPTSAITLAGWVKNTNNQTSKWGAVSSFFNKANAYNFGPAASNNRQIKFQLFIGGAWKTLTYTPADIAQWHHYAATYDGANMRIWIDGVNVASMAQTGAIASNANPLYFGRNGTTYIKAQMDEMRLYNAALTSTDIANLYGQTALSVTGLTVNSPNAANYSVQSYSLATGISQYGDVTKNFTTIPSKYLGATFLRTANADVTSTASNLITFTVNQPVILSVAFDDAIAVKPTWLTSQFTDTGDNIVTAQGTFSVYNVLVSAGTITLGGAGGIAGQGLYSVFFNSVL